MLELLLGVGHLGLGLAPVELGGFARFAQLRDLRFRGAVLVVQRTHVLGKPVEQLLRFAQRAQRLVEETEAFEWFGHRCGYLEEKRWQSEGALVGPPGFEPGTCRL